MYANEIKRRVLNWLLPRLDANDLVGSELRMLDSRTIADLVLARTNALIGMEIKGIRDGLGRLPSQLETYRSMFHASYIVLDGTDPRIEQIREMPAATRMGIIVVTDSSVSVRREASARGFLEKANAARWLLRKDLESALRGTSLAPRSLDIEQQRQRALKVFNRQDLNRLAIQSVRQRLEMPHRIFVSELGKTTTSDDLLNLIQRDELISDD